MSDNKPPITVWVGDGRHTPKPYVHLEQFLAEVEYRADPKRFPSATNSSEATGLALYELAKELKEQQ